MAEDSLLIGLWEAWKATLHDELAQVSEEKAEQIHRQLLDIEMKICETPAEGLHGVAVQLGLWRIKGGSTESEARDALIVAACDTVARLSGRDCLAEANAIFERVVDSGDLQ